MKYLILPVAMAAITTGCGSVTPTRETSSGYAVFDIHAAPDTPTARLAEAIKVGLQKNTSEVRIVNGIPPSPLPEKAPRFQLVSPFKGSNFGALAAAAGQSLDVPTCDEAILTVNARDTSMARYGEGATFFACLMPYQGSYALDIYTTYAKASGGFSAAVLGATLARTVVGDSSQFIPRTIAQIVDEIKRAGASVTMVEAFP